MKTTRYLWLDLVKLFAISLVIWGHCIQQFESNYRQLDVFQIIYSFHMPLFMMDLGYM